MEVAFGVAVVCIFDANAIALLRIIEPWLDSEDHAGLQRRSWRSEGRKIGLLMNFKSEAVPQAVEVPILALRIGALRGVPELLKDIAGHVLIFLGCLAHFELLHDCLEAIHHLLIDLLNLFRGMTKTEGSGHIMEISIGISRKEVKDD